MKKTSLFILIFIHISMELNAQNYFQQEVNYTINVELDDINHLLIADQKIQYINNSPEDLEFIWFHIWPNAYKDNSTALAKHELENGNLNIWNAKKEDRGFISDLDFHVNDSSIKWTYHPEHIDICKLILNTPVKSGDTIIIKTPFKVKIPNAKLSRLGHLGQSYMITQWYPKPAVYDNNGWHIMPYLSQGEFYSEYGSFDVSITLPNNYTVGSTGDLQNKSEIERINLLSKISDTITNFGTNMSFPKSEERKKTIRYIQKNIHDFGWFADKRYHILQGSVDLPYSGRKVHLYTMFTNNEAHLWKNSIEYMRDAIYYYSLWNGDYPFNHCTAVDGTIAAGGGMEYPNVTVIGESNNERALETVIMHEVGHNWFYGILGNNERDYAWMDEGINSYYENRYMNTKYPNEKIIDLIPSSILRILDLTDASNKQIMGELIYFMGSWTAKDQPIEFPSENYTPINYGGIVYMKTGICFEYLEAYLGQELFDQCMREYFETWKFKHPQPKDLKKIFEDITKKNLSWFFDNMIKTTNRLDYSINKVVEGVKKIEITIENKGEISGPFVICGIKDSLILEKIWIDGFEGKKTIYYPKGSYDYICIDYFGEMPEVNRNNNFYKTKGLFKKIEPIKLQIIGSLYNPNKTQIFYHPNINWNDYNKLSLGLNIYNKFIPQSGFSFKLSSNYSFGTNNVVGRSNISYTNYSHSLIFSKIKLSLELERFNWTENYLYNKIVPSLNITINERDLRSKKENNILILYNILKKEGIQKSEDPGWDSGNDNVEERNQILNISYSHKNNKTINPYDFNLSFENGDSFTKGNFIFNHRYQITKSNSINTRFYTGISNINAGHENYNLQMSAWNGSMDYAYYEKTFSRDKNGNLSRQMFVREGGIKHYTDIRSDNLLTSLSLDYNFYKFLSFYIEGGYANGNKWNESEIAFGNGFSMEFNGIKIYIPCFTENGLFNNQDFIDIIRIKLESQININNIFQ